MMSIQQEEMNKTVSFPQFRGSLNLELDQSNVKMEFKGQSVKVTFSSLKALRMFVFLRKNIEKSMHPFLIQDWARQLTLTYYLADFLIGESNQDLKPSWLGSYFGLERSKIYFSQFIAYFFNLSKSRKVTLK